MGPGWRSPLSHPGQTAPAKSWVNNKMELKMLWQNQFCLYISTSKKQFIMFNNFWLALTPAKKNGRLQYKGERKLTISVRRITRKEFDKYLCKDSSKIPRKLWVKQKQRSPEVADYVRICFKAVRSFEELLPSFRNNLLLYIRYNLSIYLSTMSL